MVRRSFATAGLLALALLMVGCDIIEPCDLTDEEIAANALDRRWQIATVNGAPIPPAGVNIPESSDRLVFGTLNFHTLRADGACLAGDGKDPYVRDDGRVVAVYSLVNSAGVAKQRVYTGSFFYDHRSGLVSLQADTTIHGARVLNDMTFTGSIRLFGNHTIKFQKVD